MITKNNPRRYEISLWTLQDSFITVLKSFNLDNFGTIEEPDLQLADDSEDKFSFKIPMYIKEDGAFKENPIWYNTTNGNLIINLRKIKVVFHKGESRQKVFEFIITKIVESHEGFEKYCEIECEGLAYNELGKTGYNIELSQDNYEIDYIDGIYQEDNNIILDNDYLLLSQQSTFINEIKIYGVSNEKSVLIEPQEIEYNEYDYTVKIKIKSSDRKYQYYNISYKYSPINNIDYWVQKVIPNSFSWTYKINMNWDSYYGENRQSNKIYEDAYIENWELNEDNKLVGNSIIKSKEKLRIVTESASNRYNLTQAIAETFGVYCRYIYEYDDNLCITNRIIEFYNTALKEDEEILDFTYYYDTESISREMDSADQISKMFVIANDNELLEKSITNVNANKSLENYLLNFDYLYHTGAIDDDQKQYIEEFEIEMRKYNLQLQDLSNKIMICQQALNDFLIKKSNAILMEQNAQDAMDGETAYIKSLYKSDVIDYDNNPQTLSKTGLDPEYVVIIENQDDGSKYCNIHREGVLPNSILVFTSILAANNFHKAIYEDINEDLGYKIDIKQFQNDDKIYYTAVSMENNNNEWIRSNIKFNGNDTFDNYAQAYEAAANWLFDNKITKYLPSTNYQVVIDPDTGFATGLKNIEYDGDLPALYLVYNYNLQLYHQILLKKWAKIQNEQQSLYQQYAEVVEKIDGKRDENNEWVNNEHGLLQDYLDTYNQLLKEKEQKILDFENYLGPAIREGTWRPEDNYAKYGDKHQALLSLESTTHFKNKETSIGWDNCLFVGEKNNYDKIGIEESDKFYYPCVILTPSLLSIMAQFIQDDISINDIGFVWDDTVVPGINKLIGPSTSTYTDAEIKQRHDDWATLRDILEQQENPSIADKERLKKLWELYRQALNSKLPELEYPQIYRIGAESEIGFLRLKNNLEAPVIPVLMLTNADSYCSSYDLINNTGASPTDIFKTLNGKIGTLEAVEVPLDEEQNTIQIKYLSNILSTETLKWIEDEDLEKYDRVYPRIKIPYLNFVENNDDCKISVNNSILDPYNDYTIMNRYDVIYETTNRKETIEEIVDINDLSFWLSNKEIKDASFAYYITIKPEVIIRNNLSYGTYQLFYKLSNTALAIYLDAIEVLKENSIPKVNYEITPLILKTTFMEEAYNKIHTIININDPELKFENVQGYIYSVSLKLDSPSEDTFEVKNYTSKFEDLFSSIVASTAQIQRNAIAISVASQAFSSTGEITQKTLQDSINLADLTLKFNDNNFIIDNSGIQALSDDGIVFYTSKGIFTATDKDADNNWNWNTSILPSGINANSITAGQLNTNLIRIYSGEDLRFQWNSDGLFAYKSWLSENLEELSDTEIGDNIKDSLKNSNGLDPAQYVVMNSDGLFLAAKKGAHIIDEDNQIIEIQQDVNRVEISWDGLVLRNNQNQRTFFADPDTGNLNITGNINVKGEYITAELSENKLRLGQYELVTTEINDSECLSFVYEFEAGE